MFAKQLLTDLHWDLCFRLSNYSAGMNFNVFNKTRFIIDISLKNQDFDLVKAINLCKAVTFQNFFAIKPLKKSKFGSLKKFRIQTFFTTSTVYRIIKFVYFRLYKSSKKFHTFSKVLTNTLSTTLLFGNLGELPIFENLKYDYFNWAAYLNITFFFSIPSSVVFSKFGFC